MKFPAAASSMYWNREPGLRLVPQDSVVCSAPTHQWPTEPSSAATVAAHQAAQRPRLLGSTEQSERWHHAGRRLRSLERRGSPWQIGVGGATCGAVKGGEKRNLTVF